MVWSLSNGIVYIIIKKICSNRVLKLNVIFKKQIAPFFQQLSTKYPDAVFLKVDVDKCPGTAAANNVSAMPTFVFLRRHAEIDRIRGANKEQLEDKIKKNYASNGGSQEQGTSSDSNGTSVGVEGDFVK